MDAVKEAEGAMVLYVDADESYFRYQPRSKGAFLRITSS